MNRFLNKWLMLYNCVGPQRGINFRVSDKPWGPWSDPRLLFDPWRDRGYCYFMHSRDHLLCPEGSPNPKDVLVFRTFGDEDWGGEYGPFVIDAYTTGDETTRSTVVYFTMSTWNPYQVVLMKSRLIQTRSFVP